MQPGVEGKALLEWLGRGSAEGWSWCCIMSRSRGPSHLNTALGCLKPIIRPGVTIHHRQTTNKASWGDGIPAELFQILKDGAVKVLHSLCQKIWKSQQGPQDWKRSVFIPTPKKINVKECLSYCTIVLISHANKSLLKILQVRLQQYMNPEFPDVQAGFRKGRGTRDQIANTHWIIEKQRKY